MGDLHITKESAEFLLLVIGVVVVLAVIPVMCKGISSIINMIRCRKLVLKYIDMVYHLQGVKGIRIEERTGMCTITTTIEHMEYKLGSIIRNRIHDVEMTLMDKYPKAKVLFKIIMEKD